MKIRHLSVLLVNMLLLACSDTSVQGGYDDDAWGGYTPTPGDAGDDDSVPLPTPPPEVEDDFLATRPMATDAFVFIANPSRDTVSKIRASDRSITTIGVGDEPTQVLVDPMYARAVAFNQGSDTVSVIDVATDAVEELAVREDFNRIAMSPDGTWVISWFDAKAVDANFDVEGVRSFTEISVVDLVSLEVQDFSVGFNPERVLFTGDSLRAVLSSDEYLGVVELTTDPIEVRQHFLDVPIDNPAPTAEIVLTPAGTEAFVRKNGVDELRLVDLNSGLVTYLDAGLAPSDLDLAPGGNEVVLVSRGSQELRLFDAQNPIDPPIVLSTPASETVGSLVLSADGLKGLLYTNAVATNHITFWDRSDDSMSVRSLVKPIENVSLSPDGRSALVVHTLGDVAGDLDYWTDHYAISVISLENWIVNPVATVAHPMAWANSNDGRYSIFIMEGSGAVGVVDFLSRLVDDILVPSQPVFVGIMPGATQPGDNLAWVSQEHALGRISFVGLSDLSVGTITGFELNTQID